MCKPNSSAKLRVLTDLRYWLVLICPAVSTGCGGFVTDTGIFPLPAIHFIFETPENAGMAYEQLQLKSANGQAIYGWFVPAEGAKATILIHHGALFNRSTYIPFFRIFHDHGYHVLIYDYQGFGESFVLASLETTLDDANAALAHLRGRTEPGTDKIVIFGNSMGTLPALAQAAETPAGVVGVIVEGAVQQQWLSDVGFFLLGILPSPGAIARIPPELDPVINVRRVKLPKLFMHSVEDDVTFFPGAKILFDEAIEPKTLASLTGVHGLGFEQDPAYLEHLLSFLEGVPTEK